MKKTTLTLLLLASCALPAISFAEDVSLAPQTSGTVTTYSTSTGKSFTVYGTSTLEIETTYSTSTVKSFTLCSQESIEKRDSSIAASRSIYNIAMNNALTERKNKEKEAVALIDIDEKNDAIKLSVDTYKRQTKDAQNELTEARKITWAKFDTDVSTCRDMEQNQLTQEQTLSKESPKAESRMLMSEPASKEMKAPEAKTFRETIKIKIESFISLFN
jgi:DNA repair ATPase RecN